MRQKLAGVGLVMQKISFYNKLNNIQEKNFLKMNSMKIIIFLTWVTNSMVIFTASYTRLPKSRAGGQGQW